MDPLTLGKIMKTAVFCAIMGFQVTASAYADNANLPAAIEEAEKCFLAKIDKAQEDYLNKIRLALRKTTAIEVFLLSLPGKEDVADPFDEGDLRRFVAPHSGWAFEVLNSARLDKTEDVVAFLDATVMNKGGDILMFPYFPSVGFHCFSGKSQLFSATIDMKSRSMKIIYPDGQWSRSPINIKSAMALLDRLSLHLKTDAQQAGTGQPATRPESKTEGGDKPQPAAEGRSR